MPNLLTSRRILRPFRPDQIQGLGLWMDAADASTISQSTGVSEWRDKSPNRIVYSQPTGSSQPAYLGNQLQGLPGVKFNGSQHLSGTSLVTGDTPWTIFGVGRRDSDTNNGAWFCLANDKSFGLVDSLTGGAPSWLNGGLAWTAYNGAAIALNSSVRLTLTRSGTTTTAIRDGVADKSVTQSIASAPYGNSFVGGQSATVRCVSTVFEIIVYSRVLDASELRTIHNYLFAKWGTP